MLRHLVILIIALANPVCLVAQEPVKTTLADAVKTVIEQPRYRTATGACMWWMPKRVK